MLLQQQQPHSSAESINHTQNKALQTSVLQQLLGTVGAAIPTK